MRTTTYGMMFPTKWTKKIRLVIVPDLQIPYNHQRATENVIQFIKAIKPDAVAIVGDEADLPMLSKWEAKSRGEYSVKLQSDLDATRSVLSRIRKALGDDKKIHLVRSNHTDRFERYIDRNAPALTSLRGLKYTDLIGVKDLGITWHEQPGLIAPNTILAHGDEGSLAQYAGGTAVKLVERMGKNVVCGHTHRQGIIWRSTGLRGRLQPLFGFEAGHLMAVRKAAYTRPLNAPNWQMGFGLLEVSGSIVNPIPIIMDTNGSFTWDKKRWG